MAAELNDGLRDCSIGTVEWAGPLNFLWGSHRWISFPLWAGAGAGGWIGVRKKYCWLAGGWKLVLERCERKILLDWRLLELPNRVKKTHDRGGIGKIEFLEWMHSAHKSPCMHMTSSFFLLVDGEGRQPFLSLQSFYTCNLLGQPIYTTEAFCLDSHQYLFETDSIIGSSRRHHTCENYSTLTQVERAYTRVDDASESNTSLAASPGKTSIIHTLTNRNLGAYIKYVFIRLRLYCICKYSSTLHAQDATDPPVIPRIMTPRNGSAMRLRNRRPRALSFRRPSQTTSQPGQSRLRQSGR
ncbi:hypothetical protein PVAP13_5NG039608 [Panicum virgatum]|uniref:Uncharacterized protein n=1 Tax=Panicum virgatum TaxID=38727 RepID=A0A8T0RLW4_PANVG|nr:hypothetical protein PVAP13_5NG039608 [Panicum virgatum]